MCFWVLGLDTPAASPRSDPFKYFEKPAEVYEAGEATGECALFVLGGWKPGVACIMGLDSEKDTGIFTLGQWEFIKNDQIMLHNFEMLLFLYFMRRP